MTECIAFEIDEISLAGNRFRGGRVMLATDAFHVQFYCDDTGFEGSGMTSLLSLDFDAVQQLRFKSSQQTAKVVISFQSMGDWWQLNGYILEDASDTINLKLRIRDPEEWAAFRREASSVLSGKCGSTTSLMSNLQAAGPPAVQMLPQPLPSVPHADGEDPDGEAEDLAGASLRVSIYETHVEGAEEEEDLHLNLPDHNVGQNSVLATPAGADGLLGVSPIEKSPADHSSFMNQPSGKTPRRSLSAGKPRPSPGMEGEETLVEEVSQLNRPWRTGTVTSPAATAHVPQKHSETNNGGGSVGLAAQRSVTPGAVLLRPRPKPETDSDHSSLVQHQDPPPASRSKDMPSASTRGGKGGARGSGGGGGGRKKAQSAFDRVFSALDDEAAAPPKSKPLPKDAKKATVASAEQVSEAGGNHWSTGGKPEEPAIFDKDEEISVEELLKRRKSQREKTPVVYHFGLPHLPGEEPVANPADSSANKGKKKPVARGGKSKGEKEKESKAAGRNSAGGRGSKKGMVEEDSDVLPSTTGPKQKAPATSVTTNNHRVAPHAPSSPPAATSSSVHSSEAAFTPATPTRPTTDFKATSSLELKKAVMTPALGSAIKRRQEEAESSKPKGGKSKYIPKRSASNVSTDDSPDEVQKILARLCGADTSDDTDDTKLFVTAALASKKRAQRRQREEAEREKNTSREVFDCVASVIDTAHSGSKKRRVEFDASVEKLFRQTRDLFLDVEALQKQSAAQIESRLRRAEASLSQLAETVINGSAQLAEVETSDIVTTKDVIKGKLHVV